MSGGIVLAPRGFPWRAIFVGLAVFALCMGAAFAVWGVAAGGGAMVVSGLLAIAAFAASLG